MQFAYNLKDIYCPITLLLIALQNINEGSTQALLLAATLTFLEHMVEPQTTTWYMILITLPEVCSLGWALFASGVPIYGKRGHIVLAACL